MNSDQTNRPKNFDAEPTGPGERPSIVGEGPLEVVTVNVLNRTCRFKSNRPELVKRIASMSQEETALVREQFPGVTNELDLAAQVAFRLARRLDKCLRDIRDLHSSLDAAEERVERLAREIDKRLGE
jgi:hypothetical protein